LDETTVVDLQHKNALALRVNEIGIPANLVASDERRRLVRNQSTLL